MRVSLRLTRLVLGVALLLTLVPFTSPVRAAFAATTFQVTGNVSDQTGTVVVGASVVALDASGVTVASAITGADGRYTLTVVAGTYVIQVTPPASSTFGATTMANQVIGGDTTLDVTLNPAGWEKVFLSPFLLISSLAEYQGRLYALMLRTTYTFTTSLVVTDDGTNWSPVATLPASIEGTSLFVYNNRLYMILILANKITTIYYFDGTQFILDYSNQFNVPYPAATSFAVYQGDLYAILSEYRIFKRISDGNWTMVASIPNRTGRDLESFGGCLYGGFGFEGFAGWPAELWRDCGQGWTRFANYQPEMVGNPAVVMAIAQYDGKLYVGTGPNTPSYVFEYTQSGANLLRTTTWITGGVTSLQPLGDELWMIAGKKIFRKTTSTDWVLTGDFSSPVLASHTGNNVLILFKGHVYFGLSTVNLNGNSSIYRYGPISGNQPPTATAGGPYRGETLNQRRRV